MTIGKNKLAPNSRFPGWIVSCMIIGVVASAGPALAQDWQFEPIFKIGGEFDDNAALNVRTDQEVELSGTLLNVEADVQYSSANTTFSVKPEALFRSYSGDSAFDSDDFFVESRFNHERQSSKFGFRANYEQQAVRTAERAVSDLDIEDPDEIADDATGDVVIFGTRNTLRFTPNWEYRVSNISTIGAAIGYNNIEYDDVIPGSFTDYEDARLNLNYRRTFSNVNSGLFTLTGRRYSSANSPNDITGFGVMAGFEHRLSEKTRVRAMLGIEDSDQSGFETDPQFTTNVTLIRTLETINIFAQYRRTVSGSGAGAVVIRDAVNFNFRRRLNEKITAGLGVRAYRSGDIGNSTAVVDRSYVQLHSSFRWYLTTSFVVEADYRYTINDIGGALGGRSNSNQVNLWFVYQPRTIPKI